LPASVQQARVALAVCGAAAVAAARARLAGAGGPPAAAARALEPNERNGGRAAAGKSSAGPCFDNFAPAFSTQRRGLSGPARALRGAPRPRARRGRRRRR
jgi:hypothetical protein